MILSTAKKNQYIIENLDIFLHEKSVKLITNAINHIMIVY